MRLLNQRHERSTRRTSKGNTCRLFLLPQQRNGGGICTPCKLQWARRSQSTDPPPQLHRRPGRPGAHITTHGTTIQLPERLKPVASQAAVTPPELPGKSIRGESMTFQATAHRQSLQRHTGAGDRPDHGIHSLCTTSAGVDFDSIGMHLRNQLHHRSCVEAMVALLDQAERACRQTAAAAIAAPLIHCKPLGNRISGANPFTGSRAPVTEVGVKPSLAEMSIRPITDTHHQPGG